MRAVVLAQLSPVDLLMLLLYIISRPIILRGQSLVSYLAFSLCPLPILFSISSLQSFLFRLVLPRPLLLHFVPRSSITCFLFISFHHFYFILLSQSFWAVISAFPFQQALRFLLHLSLVCTSHCAPRLYDLFASNQVAFCFLISYIHLLFFVPLFLQQCFLLFDVCTTIY